MVILSTCSIVFYLKTWIVCSNPAHFFCVCVVLCRYKVKVTLRLTVSQSVCLGVKPKSGTSDQRFFFPQSYCLVFLGRPLWREVGSVMCQSLSMDSTIVSVDTALARNQYPIQGVLPNAFKIPKICKNVGLWNVLLCGTHKYESFFVIQHLNSSHFFNWINYTHAAYTSTQIIILYQINESYFQEVTWILSSTRILVPRFDQYSINLP
jgi:hypothetical protein